MDDVFEVIANPTTSRAALIDAIRRLGPVIEQPSFWSAIANDAAHSPDHRRRAVFELFLRHVSPGLTLGDLARLLDGPTWLSDDDISVVDVLGGKIPVTWTFDDTVLVLAVFPDLPDEQYQLWAIYLRVAGKVDLAEARSVLRGGPAEPAAGHAEIREVGYAPADPSRPEA